ncbi:hypothetical protein K2Z83_26135 [Oscillochloris sp. ZM17-4]|uniref:hypothetical protein n=1 Tax=Oscillochloris sp. ZM17-4 TaxID=2866714 RepID=UPI001C72C743|nr:hypothetical protein [Oscillochloris sp. ZM17-4]MBX0331133.1 hypothetical protein [Oscillochloris sp. ZM17-4]
MRDLTGPVTAPETAWLINVVPVSLTLAATLVVVFMLRERLMQLIVATAVKRAARARQALPAALVPDVALIWTPPALPPATFLGISVGATVIMLLVTSMLFSPIFVAMAVTAPLTAGLVWVLIQVFELRYTNHLERDLTAAVGRMSALLRSGNGYRQSLVKLLDDMDPGPLRAEWRFLIDAQGAPLSSSDGIATPQQVTAALSAQTPSRRHATFLNHLAVAVGQPQDVLVTRVKTAYEALQASDRRRDEAVTQLAQMRYSGMAVGLAGMVMALYLFWTQWDRVVIAYSSPLGMVVGGVVAGALLLPIVGGVLLARADDIDY